MIQCRRCLAYFAETEKELKKTGHDDSPQAVVYRIAADLPTMLCLTCYEDYLIEFQDMKHEHDTLASTLDLVESNVLSFEGEIVTEMLSDLARICIDWNIAVVRWVRVGVPNS